MFHQNLKTAFFVAAALVSTSESYAQLTATANGTPSCLNQCNGTATVTTNMGMGANLTYQWSNGATGAGISGLCPGQYVVTVTDPATGNTATAVYSVASPTAPIMIGMVQTHNTCNGSCNGALALQVAGGYPPYTYQWSSTAGTNVAGQTGSSISGLCQGVYHVTVTDANGCVAVRTHMNIYQPQPIQVMTSSTSATCQGQVNGSMSATATGGTAPYTFQWSNGSNAAAASNVGPGTYTVTVTDANGCQGVSSVVVGNNCFTAAAAGSNICGGACNGTVVVTATGGVMPYTYQWSNNANVPAGANSSAAQGLCPGTYTITITDATGAVRVVSATVTYNPLVATHTTVRPTCVNACNGSATVQAAGGTGPYTYQWSNGQTGPMAQGLCAGTYSVTITDAAGCVLVRNNIFVLNPNPIMLSTNVTPSGCNPTGTASVTVTGGNAPYTFQWITVTGAPVSNAAQAGNLAPGTYTVIVTDANGCQRTATVVVGNVCNGSGGGTPMVVMDDEFETLDDVAEVQAEQAAPAIRLFQQDINETLRSNDFPQVSVFNVYPNPNQGQFTIDIELAAETEARLRIHDVLGRTIHEENLQGQFFRLPVNAGTWEPGAYYVQLVSRDGQTTRRVVIAK